MPHCLIDAWQVPYTGRTGPGVYGRCLPRVAGRTSRTAGRHAGVPWRYV